MADRRARGERARTRIAGNADDPLAMPCLVARFLDHLGERNYAVTSIDQYAHSLGQLSRWLDERGIDRPSEVSAAMLERFQRWLHHYRKRDGRALSASHQGLVLQEVKTFFRYLRRRELIAVDPSIDIELPRKPRLLPRSVPSHREIEAVMSQPDITTPLGLRNRTIVEVLYATGIRRAELGGLRIEDIDFDRARVFVRNGKGAKDRVVPISERALTWVHKYLVDSRPLLVRDPDHGWLIIGLHGERLGFNRFTEIVHEMIAAADLGKGGACHTLRHSMATALLDGGANLRVIQEILGHADLTSTQIYTHVAINQLQDAYNKAHPAARAARSLDPGVLPLIAVAQPS